MNEQLSQYSLWAIAAVVTIALLLLLYRGVASYKSHKDDRLIKKLFKRHNQEFKCNVGITDGIDGFLFVDYLLLIRGNLIALKIINKPGYIFGAENIDEWTCVQNNRTEKFNNPITSLNLFSRELKRLLDFENIRTYALFGSQSRFEKGKPEGVLLMSDLEAMLRDISCDDRDYEAAHRAWERFLNLGPEYHLSQ